ncbi:hypothetical protein [Mesorhizobium sp.]|uniref:hypothetical protein n=1 Tax=Mesorhizobium sp. TaxID=1871066 RepID=UPI000FE6FFA7|nr:hypothetical protein [Mesorhizobium sp.]RWI80806.1 MAG: hypothetical protein EOR19_01940 [Mesorhizobium sp.]
MTKEQDSTEIVMAAVQRRAMEIVALPVGEREARYALFRESYLRAARNMNVGKEEAWTEMAEKMIEFTRDLVRIIEAGGGGGGGTA